jgi:plastocyanin
MYRKVLTASFLALFAIAGPAAAGSEVNGKVKVTGRPAAATVTTVVYAEPLEAQPPAAPKTYKLFQKDKSFSPRVLAIPVGSSVEFINEDPILHNVFSLSTPSPFDLGLYKVPKSKTRTFNAPSLYRVFCNIHPQMTAVILVVATPYIAEADAAGNYRLDLPPGRYKITAWSERSTEAAAEVTVASSGTTAPDLTLDESHYVEMPHKNKYGDDYPKQSDGSPYPQPQP